MDVDCHDASREVNEDKLREEFVNNYKADNINMATNPIMCRFCDTDNCDANRYMEMAKVAAVSGMHHCIPSSVEAK